MSPLVVTPGPADILEAKYWVTESALSLQLACPPSFVSSVSAGNPDITSLTSGMPAGFISGDLLLAALTSNVAPTTPTGWTLLDSHGILYLYTKIANGTETSVTWALGGVGAAQSKVRAYRGTETITVLAHGVQAGLTSPSLYASFPATQVTVFSAQQPFTTSAITPDPAMMHTDGGGNTVTYMISGDETINGQALTSTRTGTISGSSFIDYESATIVLAGSCGTRLPYPIVQVAQGPLLGSAIFANPVTVGNYVWASCLDFFNFDNILTYGGGTDSAPLTDFGAYWDGGNIQAIMEGFTRVTAAGVHTIGARATGGGTGRPMLYAVEVSGGPWVVKRHSNNGFGGPSSTTTDSGLEVVFAATREFTPTAGTYTDAPSTGWATIGNGYTYDSSGTIGSAGAYLISNSAQTVEHLPSGANVGYTVIQQGFVITDNFNRTDSTSTINLRSDGGAWSLDAGVVGGITSNQGYFPSGSDGQQGARGDLGSTSQDVQCTFVMPDPGLGSTTILFAVSPTASNQAGYVFWVLHDTTLARIFDYRTMTVRATVPITSFAGGSSTFRVIFNTATGVAAVYQNGTSVFSGAISGAFSLDTWCGFSTASGPTITFDNFQAKPL